MIQGVDRIVCINLDRRPDRWGAFLAKIDAFPWRQRVQRIRAVEGGTTGNPCWYLSGSGAWGCRQSHLRVLEDAMMDGVETLLVFEDDCCFGVDFTERLEQLLRMAPSLWQAMMLGGQRMDGEGPELSEGILRSISTTRTHAFVLRGQEAMRQVYSTWASCDTHIDSWNHRWQSKLLCVEPRSFLCGQDEGRSDIAGQSFDRRYWSPISGAASPKVYILDMPRDVAEQLIPLGVHFGNARDARSGRDKGMMKLASRGYPQEGMLEWLRMITAEAADADCLPAIWETGVFRNALKGLVEFEFVPLKAMHVHEVEGQLPSIRRAADARRVMWAWRGDDRVLLEGLAFHGFHRGYHVDHVSGLDHGVRAAIAAQDYEALHHVARQLQVQAHKIRRGKTLIAHPQLDVGAWRSHSSLPILELSGGTIREVMETFWQQLDVASS